MNLTDKDRERFQKEARVAFRTAAYQENFDLYWHMTASLRTGRSDEYWQTVRELKKSVWDDEGPSDS